jgi:hypothetical protein
MKQRLLSTLTMQFLVVACLLSAVGGCGNSGPEVVEIEGVLTRGGKPVPLLSLSFQPAEGRPSWARADENGRFKVFYDDQRDGARVGMHTVVVRYKPQSMAEEMGQTKGKHHPEEAAILEKYGPGGKEPLKIEIKEATDNLEIKLD